MTIVNKLRRLLFTTGTDRNYEGSDPVLAAVAVALIGIGIVMVYSASAVEATVAFKDPQYFLKRHVIYAVAALLIMAVISRLDYRRLRHALPTYAIYGGVVVLLLACVLGYGKRVGGAARWLLIGPVHVQPAEMAKLALVLWLAYSLTKKGERVKSFSVGFVPHLLAAGLLMTLLIKQPDLGSAVVLLLLTFSLLFAAGAKLGYILGALLVGAGGTTLLILSKTYRMARLMAFVDMDNHRQDVAYQPFQSVMSFGSGGVTGLGLGHGLQVLYLPEAHTDFVAAIVGEELGFIGVCALVAAYLLLVSRGIRTALQAEDDYGSYLAFGISTMFGIQVLVNLAVAMAIVPTKGLTLPFLSYGGSSLLVNAAAVGLLLSISHRAARSPGEPLRLLHDQRAPPPVCYLPLPTVRYTTLIHASVAEVFAFHERPEALTELTPPWAKVQIITPPTSLAVGTRVVLRTRIGPFWKRWVAEHTAYEAGHFFEDKQVSGPFASWVHRHQFEPVVEHGEENTLLTDEVTYEVPLGALGQTLGGWFVRKKIDAMFAYRHEVTRRTCETPTDR